MSSKDFKNFRHFRQICVGNSFNLFKVNEVLASQKPILRVLRYNVPFVCFVYYSTEKMNLITSVFKTGPGGHVPGISYT
ncbi:hypothetical protein DQM68_18835 [Leptospira mayottensis]|nr:hypothetical protein DQM68_18835 [Leptospira mayottensis]AZQ04110.1 hypothetical protein LEP1GSC190_18910 [Leptospira mayottensis 200901116]